ncbi:MAG: glutathione synthase [Pseudomonadota bacterium]
MIKCAFVTDPIDQFNPKKEATLAMLHEAEQRQYENYYLTPADLFIEDGVAYGKVTPLKIHYKQLENWYELGESQIIPLKQLDCIIMRKDPPVDMEFIYSTYVLEMAEKAGVLVVNKPQSLRDFNEKVAICDFPQCCAPTLVSSDKQKIHDFVGKHSECVLKPLDNFGGQAIFYVTQNDVNTNVIIETLTQQGGCTIMAQQYIPEVEQGSRRVVLIDGEPLPYVLARVPPRNEIRGNIVLGAKAVADQLTAKEQWICQQIGPTLKAKGLLFVGIDVIGDYLTEINVTSVGIIQETDAAHNINLSGFIFAAIEKKLRK